MFSANAFDLTSEGYIYVRLRNEFGSHLRLTAV